MHTPERLAQLRELQEAYKNNENIMALLRTWSGSSSNSLSDILLSYDLQSGSYISQWRSDPQKVSAPHLEYASILNDLGPLGSICEVGVGEATTLCNLLKLLKHKPDQAFGFDISWSRIMYARQFVKDELTATGLKDPHLVVGDLFKTPYKDNAFDVVYTAHSIEPNGGKETEALVELYRIAKKYLVLFEPGYELTQNTQAKLRMEKMGYIRNLHASALALGYDVMRHSLIENPVNPLNPTAALIIKKEPYDTKNDSVLACPITHETLIEQIDSYICPDGLLAYPKIMGIGCLLQELAVVATHLGQFIGGYPS